MKQHKHLRLAQVLRSNASLALLCAVGVLSLSAQAVAVCKQPGGTDTNPFRGWQLSINNQGTSQIVTGTANPDNGVNPQRQPNFQVQLQIDKPTAVTPVDPAPSPTPCQTYYSHNMMNDNTNTATGSITFTSLSGSALGAIKLSGAGTQTGGGSIPVSFKGQTGTFNIAGGLPGSIRIDANVSFNDASGHGAGTVNLNTNGSANSAGGGTTSATFKFFPALAFVNAPLTSHAGACVGPITTKAINGDGSSAGIPNPAVTLTVTIVGNQVFQDALCKIPASNDTGSGTNFALTLGGSSSTSSVYIRTATAGNFPVAVSYDASGGNGVGNNAVNAHIAQSENIQPNTPTFIKFSGPSAFSQGECSAAVTAHFLDNYGNVSPLSDKDQNGNIIPLYLTLDLSHTGHSTLYSDPNCTTALTSRVQVPAYSTSYSFYVGDRTAETVTVTAGDNTPNRLGNASWEIHVLGTTYTVATTDPAKAKALAIRLYDRLVSLPADENSKIIADMSALIQQGRGMDAAHLASQQDGFLSITVKNMVSALSNKNFDPGVHLNDFTATWLGVVRDDIPATELLTGNYIYVPNSQNVSANATAPVACADTSQTDSNGLPLSVYKTPASYEALKKSNPIDYPKLLSKAHQCNGDKVPTGNGDPKVDDGTSWSATPDQALAGLLTTRQWGKEHLYAGTNRRAVAYAFDVFLCRNIHQIADATMPDSYIHRDVSRAPAGDPAVFDSTCKSCHGGMDGLVGAFAFYDSYPLNNNKMGDDDDFRLIYSTNANVLYSKSDGTQGPPCASTEFWKMNKNCLQSPQGYVVSGDTWANYFTQNQNSSLGWAPTSAMAGSGAQSMGAMLAASDAFGACMAKRVFKAACRRDADPDTEAPILADLSRDFQSTGYNMRRLFEKAASLAVCLGNGG